MSVSKHFVILLVGAVFTSGFAVPMTGKRSMQQGIEDIQQRFLLRQQQQLVEQKILSHIQHVFEHANLPSYDLVINLNDFVDDLLKVVDQFMIDHGLNDIMLPNLTFSLNSLGLLGIDWYASASLSNGYISGLETLHRTGNVTVDIDETKITLDFSVGWDTLSAGYTVDVEFDGIGPTVTAAISVDSVAVHMQMYIDVKDLSAQLTIFDIYDIGNIQVTVTGLGIFDFLIDTIADLIANTFKYTLADIITNDIQNAINFVLDLIFPGNTPSTAMFSRAAQCTNSGTARFLLHEILKEKIAPQMKMNQENIIAAVKLQKLKKNV